MDYLCFDIIIFQRWHGKLFTRCCQRKIAKVTFIKYMYTLIKRLNEISVYKILILIISGKHEYRLFLFLLHTF